MPTEVRHYTIAPGRLDEFATHFKTNIMPTSAHYGVRVHAAWLDRVENRFIWVRSYDDEVTLERYMNSPERAAFVSINTACIESMDIRLVESLLGDLPVANQ